MRLSSLTNPVAIAMWDFSWLLRHHRGGEFADWDATLAGLVERGYDAVRIDAFPQFVAADASGHVTERFAHPKHDWSPALWGNAFTTATTPRAGLLEFLRLCRKHRVRVGLASWLMDHGTGRMATVEGLDDLVRIWSETLALLETHGLLEDVLYVDLVNEYPLWHGYTWFTQHLNALGTAADPQRDARDANIPDAERARRRFNPAQVAFLNRFLRELLARMQSRWPTLDFFVSLTGGGTFGWDEVDLHGSAALDSHLWFVHHDAFSGHSGYFQDIHSLRNDVGFERCQRKIAEYWSAHREELSAWMDRELAHRAAVARQHGIPAGNTEGWGPVCWMEHPALDWSFVRESAEVAVPLAVRHGFRFICTSNFTHPQFPGLWNDLDWHRRMTAMIRRG